VDPLAPLLELADVAPALAEARDRVDAAMRHRALRRHGGQVAAEGALRVAEGLGGLVDLWPRAPRQVLAKLHVLAARGAVPADDLGRLTGGAQRVDALSTLISEKSDSKPLLLAAVVHAELITLRPFAGPAGIVARAAACLTLIGRGFDPRGLIAVELGHLAREPEYVGAAGAYATGTPDGVRSWLRHYAAAVSAAADELTNIGDGVLAAA
jgi:hypothetical protein